MSWLATTTSRSESRKNAEPAATADTTSHTAASAEAAEERTAARPHRPVRACAIA